jgi:hypothetical protein
MPRTGWTPSIVPEGDGDDQNVYSVVDDFGRNGRAYRETDVETADLETVILGLLEGEYNNPIRLQHLRRLVAGRIGGHRPRAAPPLRPANAGRTIGHSGLRRAARRAARPATDIEVDVSNPRALRYRRLALAEQDNEKVRLLQLIADEADRGVLFTAEWISTPSPLPSLLPRRGKPN